MHVVYGNLVSNSVQIKTDVWIHDNLQLKSCFKSIFLYKANINYFLIQKFVKLKKYKIEKSRFSLSKHIIHEEELYKFQFLFQLQ